MVHTEPMWKICFVLTGALESLPTGHSQEKCINTGQLYYIWHKVINNVLNISTNL